MHQIQRQTQHLAVKAPYQFLERQTVSGLCSPDERLLLGQLHRRCCARISFKRDAHPHSGSRRLGFGFRWLGLPATCASNPALSGI